MNHYQIKEEAKIALEGNRFMYFLAILVVQLIVGLSTRLYIGILLSPILSIGLYFLGSDLLEFKKFDFIRVFHVFKNLNLALKLIGITLLYSLIVLGGMILFIVPGIIFAYQYSQSMYIMADNPKMGIWEAMKKSKEIMKGNKIDSFVFSLSFIGHILLIIITCGLYSIYIIPYIQLATINYYKHLSSKYSLFFDTTIDI